jgi:c-di-GMP-binding flagellar brake protein YcgR
MSYLTERRYPRIEFQTLPLVLALRWDEAHLDEKPVRLEGRNLSRGGIKFASNRRISLFAPVRISFFDKTNGQEAAVVTGKVVRVEEVDTGHGERTYGIAVQFSEGIEGISRFAPDMGSANSTPAT